MTKVSFRLFVLVILVLSVSCSQTNDHDQVTKTQKEGKGTIPANEGATAGKWIALFNGDNLDGWEVKSVREDQEYNFWNVADSTIVVNSLGIKDHDYNWLITQKEYDNFELKLKFQSYRDSPGNSGIQVRSRYDDQGKVRGSDLVGWLDGPQIDIHPSDPWRTGFIYDETRGHQRWIHPDLPDWKIDKETYAPEVVEHYYADEAPYWNDLVIICRGNHITTKLNGNVVAGYNGTGVLDDKFHQKYGIDQSGHIALQLHKSDELKMAYKDIYIKEL